MRIVREYRGQGWNAPVLDLFNPPSVPTDFIERRLPDGAYGGGAVLFYQDGEWQFAGVVYGGVLWHAPLLN